MRLFPIVALTCTLVACSPPSSPVPAQEVSAQSPAVEAQPSAQAIGPIVPAQAATLPPAEVQASWKAELEADCAGADGSAQRASFDMTGDDRPEQICWRVVKGPPIGEFVDIVVVHEGLRRQSAYLLLPVDGRFQVALCPGGPYSVTPQAWTDAELRDVYGIPPDWPKLGLELTGTECDPVQLFWPNDADSFEDNRVSFLFARM